MHTSIDNFTKKKHSFLKFCTSKAKTDDLLEIELRPLMTKMCYFITVTYKYLF